MEKSPLNRLKIRPISEGIRSVSTTGKSSPRLNPATNVFNSRNNEGISDGANSSDGDGAPTIFSHKGDSQKELLSEPDTPHDQIHSGNIHSITLGNLGTEKLAKDRNDPSEGKLNDQMNQEVRIKTNVDHNPLVDRLNSIEIMLKAKDTVPLPESKDNDQLCIQKEQDQMSSLDHNQGNNDKGIKEQEKNGHVTNTDKAKEKEKITNRDETAAHQQEGGQGPGKFANSSLVQSIDYAINTKNVPLQYNAKEHIGTVLTHPVQAKNKDSTKLGTNSSSTIQRTTQGNDRGIDPTNQNNRTITNQQLPKSNSNQNPQPNPNSLNQLDILSSKPLPPDLG